jgi:hypothetical protein
MFLKSCIHSYNTTKCLVRFLGNVWEIGICENTLYHCNGGVVVVNAAIVGLAPG